MPDVVAEETTEAAEERATEPLEETDEGCHLNGSFIEDGSFVTAAQGSGDEETHVKTPYGVPSVSPERSTFTTVQLHDEPLPRAPSPVAAIRWRRLGLTPVNLTTFIL